MNVTLSNGVLLGWHTYDDALRYSNNLQSAVYAFGIFDKVPDEKQLPINRSEVVYIGQSGGQESTFDRKDQMTGRGRLETSFHRRLKAHKTKGKIKTIYENIEKDKILCVCIITPKKYLPLEEHKSWLLAAESELILCYRYIFGEVPIHNLQHSCIKNKVNENSYSQKMVKIIQEKSLNKFYDE